MCNNLGESYVLFLKNIFNFKGRTRRSDFWHVILMNWLISIVFGIIFGVLCYDILASVMYLIVFTMHIFCTSLFVRRLHDIGKSGAWFLIHFVPFVGVAFYFIWYTRDSQKGINKYGSNPKDSLYYKNGVNLVDNEVSMNCCKVCGANIDLEDSVCQKCGSSQQEDRYYG